MRVAAIVHMYPPRHNAGAEWMLHAILLYLTGRGHECHVVISNGLPADTWEFEGIPVRNVGAPERIRERVHADDVLITHLDRTADSMKVRRRLLKPLVHLVHNDKQLHANRVHPTDAQLVVYNSEWLRKRVGWRGPSLVLHPPVAGDVYRTTPGEAVTLVNLNAAKGARTFLACARLMGNHRFLGVLGAYGRQLGQSAPRNVRIVPQTSDMLEVYGRTRVLLMPSEYESFGRVAIEAGHSGIPTIAHPTPGLKEALGRTGIFVDRDDVPGYVNAIEALDDEEMYAQASEDAYANAVRWELRMLGELERFEEALRKL